MIIGIDGNEANVKKRVGITEYAYQLLKQFSSTKHRRSDLDFIVYLKDEPLAHMPKESAKWRYRVLKPGKLWTQWRLPLDLFLHHPRPHVFFSPTHYAPRFSPVPSVISVMDISYLLFPEMFNSADLYQLQHWTKYSVKNATKVLTISNSSRSDIIKTYKVPEKNVISIYPGIKPTVSLDPHVYAMHHLIAQYQISENYVLFVGTLQPRKNITKLIEAFAKIKNTEAIPEDLELVIIGKKGWLYEEILEAPERYGIAEKVKFLESVTDEELVTFYKHALCYVLPSLYEGFGLPVVEAMRYGCPVITSNISSLPEAGGDAAVYVDPIDVDDIAKKIIKVITTEDLRKEMIEKGKAQVKKFSWEKSAEQTLHVLEDVANSAK